MWKDPILSNLIEKGDLKTASSLAAGRFVEAGIAEKIASLSVEEAHALATQGITEQGPQKTASVERAPLRLTNFSGLFGDGRR
jgi:hypothetical protein